VLPYSNQTLLTLGGSDDGLVCNASAYAEALDGDRQWSQEKMVVFQVTNYTLH
jgi:hypothetical protein